MGYLCNLCQEPLEWSEINSHACPRLKEEKMTAYAEQSTEAVHKDKQIKGIGGAPARATILPADSKERKKYPIATGVLDYFSDALVEISNVSYTGNEQHNPGKPVHWDRSKSGDEADTMIRHFLQRGSRDTDGTRHSAKMAWRALALLQKEIEAEQ